VPRLPLFGQARGPPNDARKKGREKSLARGARKGLPRRRRRDKPRGANLSFFKVFTFFFTYKIILRRNHKNDRTA
jgi:hypothetical protein